MSNVSEELRNMAADKTAESDQVLRVAAAVVADIGDNVEKINIKLEKQGAFNVKITKDVEANSKMLAWHNKGLWVFGSGAVLYVLKELVVAAIGS